MLKDYMVARFEVGLLALNCHIQAICMQQSPVAPNL